MKKRSFIGLLAYLIMGSISFGEKDKVSEVKVGDKAPAFELMSSAGKKVSLKDYEGKKSVVLAFSRGHW